jgi:hypothetical protein
MKGYHGLKQIHKPHSSVTKYTLLLRNIKDTSTENSNLFLLDQKVNTHFPKKNLSPKNELAPWFHFAIFYAFNYFQRVNKTLYPAHAKKK